MKIYAPFLIALRVAGYSFLMFVVAEIIRFDALYPMEDGYYGEISFTEFSQEIILLALFVLYLVAGKRFREIQPVTNLLSLLFLASFIREFNFIISWWFYLVLPVFLIFLYLVFRDFKKMRQSVNRFFSLPVSAWFFSGFLITYVFSRLMGRSSFWRLLYDENSYRLAKAATEEGLELAGNVIMLISAIELFIYIRYMKSKEQK